VGGLVQHDLQDGPAPGRQQLACDEQLGDALAVAAGNPPLGPVVPAQPVALGSALLVAAGPSDDHDVGHLGVVVLDGCRLTRAFTPRSR
jgi:hypothetical protein